MGDVLATWALGPRSQPNYVARFHVDTGKQIGTVLLPGGGEGLTTGDSDGVYDYVPSDPTGGFFPYNITRCSLGPDPNWYDSYLGGSYPGTNDLVNDLAPYGGKIWWIGLHQDASGTFLGNVVGLNPDGSIAQVWTADAAYTPNQMHFNDGCAADANGVLWYHGTNFFADEGLHRFDLASGVQLTTMPDPDGVFAAYRTFDPKVTRDGSKIALSSYLRSTTTSYRVFVLNSDGSVAWYANTLIGVVGITWSSDDSHLIIGPWFDSASDTYVMAVVPAGGTWDGASYTQTLDTSWGLPSTSFDPQGTWLSCDPRFPA